MFVLIMMVLNLTYKTRATKMVYGVEPDLTREGGSIPVTLTLQVIIRAKGKVSITPVAKKQCLL